MTTDHASVHFTYFYRIPMTIEKVSDHQFREKRLGQSSDQFDRLCRLQYSEQTSRHSDYWKNGFLRRLYGEQAFQAWCLPGDDRGDLAIESFHRGMDKRHSTPHAEIVQKVAWREVI